MFALLPQQLNHRMLEQSPVSKRSIGAGAPFGCPQHVLDGHASMDICGCDTKRCGCWLLGWAAQAPAGMCA